MLTRDQAEKVAAMTGRTLLPVSQVVDRALAKTGMSRSERRRLIAALKASAGGDPEEEPKG